MPGAGWVGGRATLCAFLVCFPSRWTRFSSVRRSALPVSSYSFGSVGSDTCPGVYVSYPAVLLDGRRETTPCVVPLLGFISTQGTAPFFIVGNIFVPSMARRCSDSSPIGLSRQVSSLLPGLISPRYLHQLTDTSPRNLQAV